MDLFGLYAQLTGQVDECCCDVETVDTLNRQKVYPVITELVARTYFKFYQVRRIILEDACLSLRVCVSGEPASVVSLLARRRPMCAQGLPRREVY